MTMSYNFFASVYDSLTDNVEYSRRAEYICSLLSENGIDGGLLLDLACGTGSMSVELALKGYSVIGVDLSEEMLSIAQEKKYETNLDMMFLCQDMRELDLYGTIDCACCNLDGINHLNCEEDIKETFGKISLFMNDGGIFIFDVNTLYKHRCVLADNCFVYDCDDVFCVWQNFLQQDNATVNIDLDFFAENEDGEYSRFSECFSEKAYEINTIKELLEQSDFTVINIFNDLTKNKPDEKSEKVIFVARRNKR